jgi:hypothetical protein
MAKKRTFGEMVAAQKAANQKTYPPIETSSDFATNTAVQEETPVPNRAQTMVPPTAASSTGVTASDPNTVDINAPAAAPLDNPDTPEDESEESVISRSMKALGDKLREAAPHIDFKAEYDKLLEENKRPERRGISPFKAFALALGGGPQAVDKLSKRANDENDADDSAWQNIMNFKEQALKGDIQQKLDEGKFKQALAQSEELAKMQAGLSRITGNRKHKQEMELEDAKIKGRKDVAEIKATTAREALNAKVNSLATAYGLEGDIKKEFYKAVFGAMAKRMYAQDITGEQVVNSNDMASVLEEAVDWAEEHTGVDLSVPLARPGAKTPAAVTPPATPGSPEDKAKAVLAKLRAAKAAKKE